jgi:hypothetical protein
MYFELVKQALSASLGVIATSRRLTREQALKKVSDHLAVMSEQWYAGEAPQIAYDDPLCRWAYVYAQVPALANLFENVIRICAQGRAEFRRKLTGEKVSVLVFGGGPGTELLGLAKYFLISGTRSAQIEVEFNSVDRVAAWIENITLIKDEINKVYAEGFGERLLLP